ncbi:MAG: metallophosphoesterase family protein [Candidatus Methylacidiphilales bacterium]|nr:metallophosphoesterase family protein [Candidatus Methylacidiphilales bacterium]
MKVALISDIHSNLEALEAVLEDCRKQGLEEFVCLGDIVGYGADPGPCVERIMALKCPALKGNHDEEASSNAPLGAYSELAQAGMAYSREVLSREHKKWLGSRPMKLKLHGASMVHSSLFEPEEWHYIIDGLSAELHFMNQKMQVCFYGHTHVPCFWEKIDEVVLNLSPKSVTVHKGPYYLFNVGSVGQPRDKNNKACYAIWNPVEQKVTYRRVPYDYEKTQKKIRQAGLPKRLATRLAEGY